MQEWFLTSGRGGDEPSATCKMTCNGAVLRGKFSVEKRIPKFDQTGYGEPSVGRRSDSFATHLTRK
jgi:hypothetical protein